MWPSKLLPFPSIFKVEVMPETLGAILETRGNKYKNKKPIIKNGDSGGQKTDKAGILDDMIEP